MVEFSIPVRRATPGRRRSIARLTIMTLLSPLIFLIMIYECVDEDQRIARMDEIGD